ncbi:hypothetical protein F5Y05DRAFT_407761 [Hypoxylon sp. FL0543]|nr:hypothetical protein F5Y05DRAFT_407761 [Hypoxylon sp. FL0543]
MSTYAVTTGVFSGITPSIDLARANPVNYSAIIEPAAPVSMLNYSTIDFFESSPGDTTSLASSVITTHIVVEIVQSSNASATEVPMVDSIPPRITIDTVLGPARPQDITEAESGTRAGSSATGGRSGVSSPSTETRVN